MAADEMSVDTLSLDDFHRSIQARLDETFTAMRALTTVPGSETPALGGFVDAGRTAGRYQHLHDEYVVRLRRLVVALAAAQVATAAIAERYRTVDDLSRTDANSIKGALGAVSEALNGGRTDGR
jgi:hypothetical protein